MDGMAIGKLLSKSKTINTRSRSGPSSSRTASASPQPSYWTVSVEGSEESSEEDISETMLGRVVDRSNASAAESDESTVAVRDSSASAASRKLAQRKTTKAKKAKKISKGAKHRKKDVVAEPAHTTRAATRSAGSPVELYGGIEEIVIPHKPRPVKLAPGESVSNGNVTKVQMLTGVLYLYWDGPKRHAKFVRTK